MDVVNCIWMMTVIFGSQVGMGAAVARFGGVGTYAGLSYQENILIGTTDGLGQAFVQIGK